MRGGASKRARFLGGEEVVRGRAGGSRGTVCDKGMSTEWMLCDDAGLDGGDDCSMGGVDDREPNGDFAIGATAEGMDDDERYVVSESAGVGCKGSGGVCAAGGASSSGSDSE